MDDSDKKEVVMERRVKSTVIRRRVKTEPVVVEAPVPAPKVEAKAPAEVPVVKKTETVAPVVSVKTVKKVEPPKEHELPFKRAKAAKAEPLVRVIRDTDVEKAKAGLKPVGHIELGETKVLPPPTTVKEDLEEKMRKMRRRKSKEEIELEDIQRAGGLLHYAEQLEDTTKDVAVEVPEVVPEAEPVERIFEPTPAMRRSKKVRREAQKTKITEPKAIKKVIKIDVGITVSALSQAMGVKTSELIKKLMGLEIMATINHVVDIDTATLLAQEHGYEVQRMAFNEEEILKSIEKKNSKEGVSRAPVVTVMGHVDHGKTSLLDALRKANVAEGEAGGITQHIGAYEVSTPKGAVTFVDTPGHEAFTHMRARGAKVTDIVILVVAADDGIMPQTIEAINHAKAAGVPIVVAMNKVDKPQANIDRLKKQLSEQGLVPEDWSGDVICVPTSAKTKEGLDKLLEMVLLVAEMKELKADPNGFAEGAVIESHLDKGRGPMATLIVQSGTLHRGDYVVCGTSYGKVRALVGWDGTALQEAWPSKPVVVLGLNEVPEAGSLLVAVADERDAKQVVEERILKKKGEMGGKTSKMTLEELQKQIVAGEMKELYVLIKTDVVGSMEALRDSILKLSNEKIEVHVLHAGVGGITENDVMLAAASKAIVVGFSVAPDGNARRLAEQRGVEIRTYSIIYEALDDIKKAMEGLLSPIEKEEIVGHASVREVFKVSKVGTIAGCQVTQGLVRRNGFVRLLRDGTVVYQGKISSLKRFKDDAREVPKGQECGISIENFNDVKAGDMIEVFVITKTAQTL